MLIFHKVEPIHSSTALNCLKTIKAFSFSLSICFDAKLRTIEIQFSFNKNAFWNFYAPMAFNMKNKRTKKEYTRLYVREYKNGGKKIRYFECSSLFVAFYLIDDASFCESHFIRIQVHFSFNGKFITFSLIHTPPVQPLSFSLSHIQHFPYSRFVFMLRFIQFNFGCVQLFFFSKQAHNENLLTINIRSFTQWMNENIFYFIIM